MDRDEERGRDGNLQGSRIREGKALEAGQDGKALWDRNEKGRSAGSDENGWWVRYGTQKGTGRERTESGIGTERMRAGAERVEIRNRMCLEGTRKGDTGRRSRSEMSRNETDD